MVPKTDRAHFRCMSSTNRLERICHALQKLDITLNSSGDYVRLHGQVSVIVSEHLLLDGCGHVGSYLAHKLVSQWARGCGLLDDFALWNGMSKQALESVYSDIDSGLQAFPSHVPFGYLGRVTGLPPPMVPLCYFQLSAVGAGASELGARMEELDRSLERFVEMGGYTPCITQLFDSVVGHKSSLLQRRQLGSAEGSDVTVSKRSRSSLSSTVSVNDSDASSVGDG